MVTYSYAYCPMWSVLEDDGEASLEPPPGLLDLDLRHFPLCLEVRRRRGFLFTLAVSLSLLDSEL